jgi:hypothetical protein
MPCCFFAAGVKQFVMVTSLGTGKIGFPASVLNLFWGVLSEKRKAEQVRLCCSEHRAHDRLEQLRHSMHAL